MAITAIALRDIFQLFNLQKIILSGKELKAARLNIAITLKRLEILRLFIRGILLMRKKVAGSLDLYLRCEGGVQVKAEEIL